jgi:hypothetical protein
MQRIVTAFAAAGLALAFTTSTAPSALADSGNAAATFGQLYHDGEIVRTVVTPASIPGRGVDAIFAVSDGVAGQLAITSVAPGAPGYHGGRWAVYVVSWNVDPYLLTSDEAVAAAQGSGDITVDRAPAADFVCPVAS